MDSESFLDMLIVFIIIQTINVFKKKLKTVLSDCNAYLNLNPMHSKHIYTINAGVFFGRRKDLIAH